ncbi:alpha-L-fucosidase [Carboxylicivirga sp. M1479]|uniref:alpha-L-fucosidase n=1 Tax=Carboxylicivirga sp. M1479 TaxID=2594476 RepID=UPI00117892AB|nr:alpha-L-fucosidase [Carboxylicivirga sp. M1479]TRX71772.1 hypothetical protein FNN09_03895 [Carboxylicivirga sp. M1479]
MNTIRLALICLVLQFSSLVYAQHHHKPHTDGIEPYYQTKQLKDYLKTIDPDYLPYMFASEENMQWWKEAKFGVLVCWDPASVTQVALSWGRHGRRPHHSTDGKITKGVPEQEYNNSYKSFNPDKFNAEEWVKLWKEAGMKYFVFLTKHHYGFCMWNTKTTEFNIMNTPYGKDVMVDIAKACEKHDMKLMWYYSQPDWTHPLYRKELPHTEYNEQVLYPQLRELMSYPGVDGIWFDGLGLPPSRWDSPKMLKIIRDVNPKAVVNHRHGTPQWHMGDFDGPERGIGRFQTNRPWETCHVLSGAWAYNGESDASPLPIAIRTLTKTAGNGGNLMLGIGPRPDGSVVDKHASRLREMGEYLEQYGESIYATQGGPYISGPWGACTYREKKVYLHLMGDIKDNELILPNLPAELKSYRALTGEKNLKISNTKKGLKIRYDKNEMSLFPVIELCLDTDATTIYPIKTQGPILIGNATITASSDLGSGFTANNLLPQAGEDFSEGIHIKKSWKPANADEQPTLLYKWKEEQQIKQINIKENRDLRASNIESYEMKAMINGVWETIHKGYEVGPYCGIHFKNVIKTSQLKIIFDKKKKIEINKILIYSGI